MLIHVSETLFFRADFQQKDSVMKFKNETTNKILTFFSLDCF